MMMMMNFLHTIEMVLEMFCAQIDTFDLGNNKIMNFYYSFNCEGCNYCTMLQLICQMDRKEFSLIISLFRMSSCRVLRGNYEL
jgi:hypothetical protein